MFIPIPLYNNIPKAMCLLSYGTKDLHNQIPGEICSNLSKKKRDKFGHIICEISTIQHSHTTEQSGILFKPVLYFTTDVSHTQAVFEIKVLFCAPSGRTGS